jgi:hypothetical protein
LRKRPYGENIKLAAGLLEITPPDPKPPGLFKRLFGKPDLTPPTSHQSAAMAKIETWTRNHPEWG